MNESDPWSQIGFNSVRVPAECPFNESIQQYASRAMKGFQQTKDIRPAAAMLPIKSIQLAVDIDFARIL